MKSYCIIRFSGVIDPNVSFILGLIAAEPVANTIKTDKIIVSTFKSYISIDKCKKMLLKHSSDFILIDVTNNSNLVQIYGSDEFLSKFLGMKKPVPVLNDDEREKDILYRIKVNGIESLTQEEHEFMKFRML